MCRIGINCCFLTFFPQYVYLFVAVLVWTELPHPLPAEFYFVVLNLLKEHVVCCAVLLRISSRYSCNIATI